MLCIRWDQLGVVYSKLLKSCKTITGDQYRTQLMRLSRALKEKRLQYQERHEKLSSSMTTHGHMSQNQSRHTWNHWNGRSYPSRRTLQKLLLPTTIFFDRRHTAWLISIFRSYEKSKWIDLWIFLKNKTIILMVYSKAKNEFKILHRK